MTTISSNTICVHHLHITGDIWGYAHSFCNKKVKENYFKIPVIAHNPFRFDFFFLIKGLRASVWKTGDIVIAGKNPTDINFAYIGNQVQFIDTIKYFQQSLGGLANSLTSSEKSSIYEECKKYLLKDEKLSKNCTALNETDQDWVLNYLSSGKGTVPYDIISDLDSLNISPEKDFFPIHNFYSNTKDSVISGEDYGNVKTFCTLLKMSNLRELNKVYNFQDTIILCEISEQRSELLKKNILIQPKKEQ